MTISRLLHASQITVGYTRPRKEVAVDLSLYLAPGELVCLLGPNGAGKSTLMRTLAGIQPPLAGQIWLDDVDLRTLLPKALAMKLSTVLTDRVEVGNLAVYDLVALGRYPYTDWTGRLQESDHIAVDLALYAARADKLALRSMNELSDGERQKVMIARALAQEPEVILLDEPTAFLDLPHRVEIMSMLRELARRTRCAILLSTHDLDLALRNADRIWLLSTEGTLQAGAPEDLVLNGAFGATFSRDGLAFDAQTGAFRTQQHEHRAIGLSGGGLAAIWTARALERAGFYIASTEPNLPWQVTVCTTEHGPCWQTQVAEQTRDHASIHAMLQYLDTTKGDYFGP